MTPLKNRLDSFDRIQAEISEFESVKNAALETLKNLETFDYQTSFSVVKAAAFAKLYDTPLFDSISRDIQANNKKM